MLEKPIGRNEYSQEGPGCKENTKGPKLDEQFHEGVVRT
jgi:hypothetical protein